MAASKFPRKAVEIIALAMKMVRGFMENMKLFPAPPVTPENLNSMIGMYNDSVGVQLNAINAANEATKDKDDKLNAIISAMKKMLRYAEITVNYDNLDLGKIGWSGKRAAGTGELPGITLSLELIAQGIGWITLSWLKPKSGGVVYSYHVEQRISPTADWIEIGESFSTRINLVSIPVGIAYEYRVYAENAAGDGEASNVISVTL